MNPESFKLTMEQQLQLRIYADDVQNMSYSDCQKIVIELITQMMVKDNILKDLLKNSIQ